MNPGGWRGRSQWLAFALSLTLVTFVLGLTLLSAPDIRFAENGEPRLLALLTDYISPQGCRECHLEQFTSWQHTTHANALFDPVFRTYLEQADNPAECLACHTTGYDPQSGQFVLAGVTCEACHGPYRAGHPEESMIIARDPEFCGECHTTTLAEWQASGHGQAGIACVDCHEVHSQQAWTTTTYGLCADCHSQAVANPLHLTHQEANIPCIECHLALPEEIVISGHIPTGQPLTGHSFTATLDNCDTCHGEK